MIRFPVKVKGRRHLDSRAEGDVEREGVSGVDDKLVVRSTKLEWERSL